MWTRQTKKIEYVVIVCSCEKEVDEDLDYDSENDTYICSSCGEICPNIEIEFV